MAAKNESLIAWTDKVDATMQAAMAQARLSFKYLWRELTWEYRRIVPGVELAAIKAAFRDPGDEATPVEHMWLSEIRFNGERIVATLINVPNRLRSVRQGDEFDLQLNQLEDWMYVMQGRMFGGYTIQRLRATMSAAARRNHDEAWGFTFPEPPQVELVPNWAGVSKPGWLRRFLRASSEPSTHPDDEHPMSENMAAGFAQAVDKDPQGFLQSCDDDGLTTLHSLALGGSAAGVRVLLEKGADPRARTKAGHTALDLAELMGWSRVADLLRGAR